MLQYLASWTYVLWATLGSIAVGVLYFLTSRRNSSGAQRLLVSAYAPACAALFVLALSVPRESWPSRTPLFLLLQAVPAALFVYSLARYSPRWAHLPLVPLALVCWAWQVAWGHTIIHGK